MESGSCTVAFCNSTVLVATLLKGSYVGASFASLRNSVSTLNVLGSIVVCFHLGSRVPVLSLRTVFTVVLSGVRFRLVCFLPLVFFLPWVVAVLPC